MKNALPAFSVALLALPIMMGFAIASGIPPMMGLATANVAGVLCGAFGSSAFNIVGPTPALVGMCIRYTATYGVEVLPWMSLISSALVVATIVLRLHQ